MEMVKRKSEPFGCRSVHLQECLLTWFWFLPAGVLQPLPDWSHLLSLAKTCEWRDCPPVAEAWTALLGPPFLWLRAYRGGEPVEGEETSEIQVDIVNKNEDCVIFNTERYTSDLGVQRRDIGTVRMSEAWQALLYSQEGNLTVAMPSCSLMDITMPTLPSTPLPTTCRGSEWQEICQQSTFKANKRKGVNMFKYFCVVYQLQQELVQKYSIFINISSLTNLDLRANLNGFFEATEGTECSNSLSADCLQLSQFPATAAPILQNTLSILPQLRDEHQGPGENLPQNQQEKALAIIE